MLNTQALHLSPEKVLDLIRDDWPIGTLETFLSRYFRRQMHELQQGQIVKSIAFAQNLEAQETAWAELRSKGGWIQDTDANGPPTSGGDEPVLLGEKVTLPEKEPIERAEAGEKARDYNRVEQLR